MSSGEGAKKVYTDEFQVKQSRLDISVHFVVLLKKHPVEFPLLLEDGKCYGGCSKCENEHRK